MVCVQHINVVTMREVIYDGRQIYGIMMSKMFSDKVTGFMESVRSHNLHIIQELQRDLQQRITLTALVF